MLPSIGKVMAIVFWDFQGVLLVEFMECGSTIDAETYCATGRQALKATKNSLQACCASAQQCLTHTARQTAAT